MEDLRSAEREGPSPIEACQIRKRGKKKIKPLLLGLIRTSTNSILLCMCVCFCVHVLIKQRGSVGLCGAFFSCFHHSLFYEAPKLRDSPNNFNESEDPAVLWEQKR